MIKCCKGIHELPHVGLLAQQLLEKQLKAHGYCKSDTTPGFWQHGTRSIYFILIVDNFGVKYVGKEQADHLIKVLREHYVVEYDWEGGKYYVINLDLDYIKSQVNLSLPG